MIHHIRKKVFKTICILIVKFFSPKNKLTSYLFNFTKNLSSDAIYFAKYEDKKNIINFINKKIKNKNYKLYDDFERISIDENMHSVVKDLNTTGISDNFEPLLSFQEQKNLIIK